MSYKELQLVVYAVVHNLFNFLVCYTGVREAVWFGHQNSAEYGSVPQTLGFELHDPAP